MVPSNLKQCILAKIGPFRHLKWIYCRFSTSKDTFVPVSRSRPLSLLWRPYIKNLNYATANIAMDVGFVPMTLVLAGQTFGIGTGFSQPAPARCSRERHIWDNVSLDESSMIETAVFTRGCMSTGVGTSRSRFELRKCDSMSCQRVPFWAPSVRTAGRET